MLVTIVLEHACANRVMKKALSQVWPMNNPYISYPTNLVPFRLDGPQLRKNAMPYIMLYKN